MIDLFIFFKRKITPVLLKKGKRSYIIEQKVLKNSKPKLRDYKL